MVLRSWTWSVNNVFLYIDLMQTDSRVSSLLPTFLVDRNGVIIHCSRASQCVVIQLVYTFHAGSTCSVWASSWPIHRLFAQSSESSFVQDNPQIVPIQTLHITYTCIYIHCTYNACILHLCIANLNRSVLKTRFWKHLQKCNILETIHCYLCASLRHMTVTCDNVECERGTCS